MVEQQRVLFASGKKSSYEFQLSVAGSSPVCSSKIKTKAKKVPISPDITFRLFLQNFKAKGVPILFGKLLPAFL